MRRYQENYASQRTQMYDRKSRELKGLRIVKTLGDFFGDDNLKYKKVLDIGASTGIIDNVLAKHFKKVTGTDIDKEAIKFAQNKFRSSNLRFEIEDAMKLSFKKSSFDIVICTHVYEHVPDPKKLFSEIYRVLKPNGVCYLAAQNKLWPMEAHHDLLFLSYLPKPLADIYIKIFRGKDEYYEHPMSYWELKNVLKKFEINEYTVAIMLFPKKFGYNLPFFSFLFAPIAKYFAPTLFWILEK
ncbi:MAG: class I SAM-dependent methyltransferase [Candidatus Woesebacteria bacterium]|nr:MAG: class I SAM-dependent methyltransferase [Candidatus Woesebacteria bacterium]